MKKDSFTLIELLVVIAIIGLISAIVIVSLGPARQKARDARRQADLKQINTAMELCYGDQNCATEDTYPDTSAGANTLPRIDPDGTPLYLDLSQVRDPLNQAPHQYTWIDGTDKFYCVYTKLETVDNAWFCACNKGTKEKIATAYTPSKDDCCGYDVDN